MIFRRFIFIINLVYYFEQKKRYVLAIEKHLFLKKSKRNILKRAPIGMRGCFRICLTILSPKEGCLGSSYSSSILFIYLSVCWLITRILCTLGFELDRSLRVSCNASRHPGRRAKTPRRTRLGTGLHVTYSIIHIRSP